jgi:hypothetical protein
MQHTEPNKEIAIKVAGLGISQVAGDKRAEAMASVTPKHIVHATVCTPLWQRRLFCINPRRFRSVVMVCRRPNLLEGLAMLNERHVQTPYSGILRSQHIIAGQAIAH